MPSVERLRDEGEEQWGAPRFQSRSPETTTLTVTKARIASDAKRRSSRPTRRRKPQSRANIPAIRWRRCARWTITRPAKARPTSAWIALRMWRSCRVPSAAAAQARRPRCTSQRDRTCHPARDRGCRSDGAPAALLRAAPWFSASRDLLALWALQPPQGSGRTVLAYSRTPSPLSLPGPMPAIQARRSAHRRPSLLYCLPAATSSPT